MFIRVEGSNVNFTDAGQFHSILDATSLRYLADTLPQEQGLGPVNYIGGGSAAFSAG